MTKIFKRDQIHEELESKTRQLNSPVLPVWIDHWYDAPLSGVVMCQGERLYHKFYAYTGELGDEVSRHSLLYRPPVDVMARLELHHSKFVQYVGWTMDYFDVDGEWTLGMFVPSVQRKMDSSQRYFYDLESSYVHPKMKDEWLVGWIEDDEVWTEGKGGIELARQWGVYR